VCVKRLKVNDIALLNKSSQSYEGHLPYGITQCYLPPNTSELARLPWLGAWNVQSINTSNKIYNYRLCEYKYQ